MTGSEHEHGHRAHAVAAGRGPHRRRMMPRVARWPRYWTGVARTWADLRPRRWTGLWPRGWIGFSPLRRWTSKIVRSRLALRLLIGSAACFAITTLAVLVLWWRLASGPIELDVATPWLKAAIEENFGGSHTVAVG